MRKRDIQSMGAIMAMALAFNQDQVGVLGLSEKPVKLKPIPYQPRGTKAYYFNEHGVFSDDITDLWETAFACFAINDKNAKRKFKNWKSKQSK